jgi:hypothetical protein
MKRQLICLMALAGATLASGPVTAAERIEFEPGAGPPIYTRLESTDHRGFHDGGWTCIPIYRDPLKIPDDFNLLEVVDPDERVQSVELLLDGFVIVEAEGQVPKLQHYEDRDDVGVPILFVRTDALQAIDDGDIMFDELFEPELQHVWGVAENYSEQVYTGWQHMIWASGLLEDGTPFIASYVHGASGIVEAHIVLGN